MGGMSRPQVRIVLPTREDAERQWKHYLCRGGAYTLGDVPVDEFVVVVLVRAGGELELNAKIVFRGGATGTGFELEGWCVELKERLEAWVLSTEPETEPETEPVPEHEAETETETETETEAEAEGQGQGQGQGQGKLVVNQLIEKLRNLPAHLQTKMAREGDQRERVMLERMYGKQVWEALLRNSRITFPEVAKIARMGTLPAPLMELIVNNNAWLRSGEIRRALLANSRLGADMIPRILRMLPKHELKLVPQQTAYAPAVRDLARKMLRGASPD